MDPLQALLIGVVAPGAVALLIVFGLRRVWRREAPMALPAAAGIALAAGFALAFALILGVPDLPPVDVTQVAPWVGLALAPTVVRWPVATIGSCGRPSASRWATAR